MVFEISMVSIEMWMNFWNCLCRRKQVSRTKDLTLRNTRSNTCPFMPSNDNALIKAGNSQCKCRGVNKSSTPCDFYEFPFVRCNPLFTLTNKRILHACRMNASYCLRYMGQMRQLSLLSISAFRSRNGKNGIQRKRSSCPSDAHQCNPYQHQQAIYRVSFRVAAITRVTCVMVDTIWA